MKSVFAVLSLLAATAMGAANVSAADKIKPVKRVLWAETPVGLEKGVAGAPRRAGGFWERSVYPIGNGRLGCTVFGEPQKDRIQFNEDSLWVGNEDCTGGYQPFGDVYVEMPHTEYSDYRRELDISRAAQYDAANSTLRCEIKYPKDETSYLVIAGIAPAAVRKDEEILKQVTDLDAAEEGWKMTAGGLVLCKLKHVQATVRLGLAAK